MPPFWHEFEQIGYSHKLPLYPLPQVQVLGAVQLPPFIQLDEQIATIIFYVDLKK